MSLEQPAPPPRFKSRKEFMEFLADMMTATVEEEAEIEFGEETRGRPRELKTYIMESNNGLPNIRSANSCQVYVSQTSLPEVSIVKLEYERRSATFYVDGTDKRFLALYTNDLADVADSLYGRLIQSTNNAFDSVWLPTETLDSISHLSGNSFKGFGLRFADLFASEEAEEQPIHELRMNVAGASSAEALEALNEREKLRRSLSRSMIRVRRGSRRDYVIDELRYSGRLITKSGASIDEHVSFVDITRKTYRGLIEEVERSSIGTKKVEGRTLVEGQAFDLLLERQVDDLELFVERLLTPEGPFRLWGLKNHIAQDMRQVVAVDLHTGDPVDLEIMPSSIRIYLPKGACGNTVLRLYTNLQHSFDSAIRFNEDGLPRID